MVDWGEEVVTVIGYTCISDKREREIERYTPDYIRKVLDIPVQVFVIQWNHDYLLKEKRMDVLFDLIMRGTRGKKRSEEPRNEKGGKAARPTQGKGGG